MNPVLPLALIGLVAIVATGDTVAPAATSEDDGTAYDPFATGDDVPSSIAGLYPDSTMNESSQINAFLAVIRQGESSGNYGAYVGGGSFTDFSHHPALPPTNWPGIPGPSHACGGYQFEPGTWKECAAALNLVDFSPASQDAAAVFLLKRRGAYQAIVDGQVATACNLLRNEWQMFTQSKWSPAMVGAMFETYGGIQA